ncbi:MAG: PaaI family thioesterase [Gammaproteobacteria bacterium]|nr:PaaI family thioesterase [Gammaproteobacteria bacterium]
MRLDVPANRCFVCGPGNVNGLNIKFRLDGEVCRAEWQSSEAYMGYEGVTHGGIQFCLLDDVMANLLYLRGFTCVTAKADVRFRNPLGIGEKVELYGRLINRRGPLAVIEGQIRLASDDTLVAESTGHFMVKGKFRPE